MDGKKKVLLIDDDHAVLAFLTAKLAKRYDVVSTVDARKSIALARTQLPDVILCDIDMPDMSGGDVAAALESDSMTARIPLIYLTALVTPEEVADLEGVFGEHATVSKSATTEELRDLVSAALGLPDDS